VKAVGAEAAVNAIAPDGVIEGIESRSHRFCLGVQWHPEFGITGSDEKLFAGLIAAARA
jgi:putative glutamine amidotransferase